MPAEPSDCDLDELFDDDYLAFYADELDDDTNQDEAESIAQLLNLRPGVRILDLPCGHGRIAHRLARMGAEVVGIDRSARFLEVARRDAAAHEVSVDYREGDMRTLSCEGEFDVVLNWFTSFGYFDDATMQDVLVRMHRALVPGGRLLIETLNVFSCDLQPSSRSHTKELVDADGTHLLVDRAWFDPLDGCLHARRLIARSREPTREVPYRVRLFAFTELRDWLQRAGFENVQAFGSDGEVFRADSRRMIVMATRP